MEIGPVKSKAPQIHFKQSKNAVLPSLPLRAMMLGNSGNGKTNLISSLITDPRFYRGVFAKIYWFSPTARIDDSLEPVREYIEDNLVQNQSEDPSFYEILDTEALAKIISRAKGVMEYLKQEKPRRKYAYNTLIVIDDLADTVDHKAQLLINQLFIKARHYGISTILSTQKLRLPLVTQAVRVNITALFVVGKLRNQSDLWDGIIYEYSALVDKAKLLAAYRQATDVPFGFLFVNLMSKDINKMFFSGFGRSFIMSADEEE